MFSSERHESAMEERQMALDSHIRQLEQKHQQLDLKLEEMLAHPSADDAEIAEIKRQKLAIKDKLHKLRMETTH
jgi:hypothetical protein